MRSPAIEITWQSAIGAFLISSLVAATYPYIVLKLGIGPNIGVVSAFLGAIFLNLMVVTTRGRYRFLNNIIQTAGASAPSTAFMCIIPAAFDLLGQNETVKLPSPWLMFTWLTCSGIMGVVCTVLFRRLFLDDPGMVFADGVAAAETIQVLDSDPKVAGPKYRVLGLATLASALVDFLREGISVLYKDLSLLPTYYFSQPYRAGIEWNLLNVGTGLLVGLNVSLSMLLGSLIIAFGVGPWIIESGIGQQMVEAQIGPSYWSECQRLVAITHPDSVETAFLSSHCGLLQNLRRHGYFPVVLLWAMWPATSLMASSAIMAVVLKWRSVLDTFRKLRLKRTSEHEDISLVSIGVWASLSAIALVVIQWSYFNMSVLQTSVAILVSLPLILVGIRVLGETNNGPVSVIVNTLQAFFAVFWPAQIGSSLVAGGVAGHINSQAQGRMQNYKVGMIIGSTPRVLTFVQLAAV